MSLGDRKVAILLEKLYEDLEFWYPYYRLKEAGAEVVVLAPKADERFTGKHGLPATSDRAVADADPNDFDAVLIPGGFSPDYMRRDEGMVSFVRTLDEGGRVVAAICHGGWMLASAGAAKGRKVTSAPSIRDDLVNAGAEWVDEEVVRDGNVITSRHPGDLPAYCRTILDALS